MLVLKWSSSDANASLFNIALNIPPSPRWKVYDHFVNTLNICRVTVFHVGSKDATDISIHGKIKSQLLSRRED